MHTIEHEGELAVARNLQIACVILPCLQIVRKIRHLGRALELIATHLGGPSPGTQHLGIIQTKHAFGKQSPLHQIHKVRGDVHNPLPLLGDVVEPWRTLQGRAGDDLVEVVNAFLGDRRIIGRAGVDLAEELRLMGEEALELGGDLEALGHDVIDHEIFLSSHGEGLAQQLEISRRDGHRLVGQNVQSRFHRLEDIAGLGAVVARDHHHVTGFFRDHALEEIRAAIDDGFP